MAGGLSIRPDGIAVISGDGGLGWQQSWEGVDKSRDIYEEDFTEPDHWGLGLGK